MKDKKRRTKETLCKRINEELYIRNVFLVNKMTKADFVKEFKDALLDAE